MLDLGQPRRSSRKGDQSGEVRTSLRSPAVPSRRTGRPNRETNMKRILSSSPVKGYQLFRFVKKKSDGASVILPNWYIRHGSKTTCTGTDRLQDAKAMIKKQAGQEGQELRRRTSRPDAVTIGARPHICIEI